MHKFFWSKVRTCISMIDIAQVWSCGTARGLNKPELDEPLSATFLHPSIPASGDLQHNALFVGHHLLANATVLIFTMWLHSWIQNFELFLSKCGENSLTCPFSHRSEEGLWQRKTPFRKKHPTEEHQLPSIVDDNCCTQQSEYQLQEIHVFLVQGIRI